MNIQNIPHNYQPLCEIRPLNTVTENSSFQQTTDTYLGTTDSSGSYGCQPPQGFYWSTNIWGHAVLKRERVPIKVY